MRWAFGEFELDDACHELFRAGQRIVLQRKPLQVLIYLVQNATRTVPSTELLREVWPHVTVTEGSLRRAVKVLRAALGGPVGGFIKSRHGYGYRFAGALSTVAGDTSPSVPLFGVTPRVTRGAGLDERDEIAQLEQILRAALRDSSFQVQLGGAVPLGVAGADAASWRLTVHLTRRWLDARSDDAPVNGNAMAIRALGR
jgi:DNA-binding winged helix-turn-helix (wHTH) protein